MIETNEEMIDAIKGLIGRGCDNDGLTIIETRDDVVVIEVDDETTIEVIVRVVRR